MENTTITTPPTLAPAVIERDPDGTFTVSATWVPREDLDRLDAAAWGVRNRHLAERLRRAIDAGAVLEPEGPYTDILGRRGWHSRSHVLGRILNADLHRLGF